MLGVHEHEHERQHSVSTNKKNKYLPDWDKAASHRLASRIGTYHEDDKQVCHCCHEPINKEEIPLCQDTKTLEFIGFGFPLFYMFLRNCIVLLFLLITTEGIISTYISVREGAQYCSEHQAAKTAVTSEHKAFIHLNYLKNPTVHTQEQTKKQIKNLELSQKCDNFLILLARTQKIQTNYEVIFRICSFMIHVFYLLFMKDSLLKRLEYYDQRQSDLSDFTIMIKSIPAGTVQVMKKITDYMNNQFLRYATGEAYIHEIILIPDTKEIRKCLEYFEEKLEHYLQHQTDENLRHAEEAEQLKNEQVYRTIEKMREDVIQSREAIIIFETEEKKFEFIDYANLPENNKVLATYLGSKEQIIVEQAPEPKEIIYENLEYQHTRKFLVFKGWGFSLLFLAFITLVFYFIQLVKTNKLVSAISLLEQNPNSQEAKTNKTIAAIIAWACLIGIVLFNKFVMGIVLHYFTHLEKHDNKGHENFSFAFKYAIGMFFTTALMTILVQALKFNNYYNHDFGVIQEETIMFILCAFIIPLIWVINPFQLMHVRNRNKHYLSTKITQHEANHLMADYHYDMGKRFAEIIEMFWFTYLYADLIPIGGILIMFGLMAYYWIDKYNLLRRASLQGNMSASIVLGCMKLLDATLFWRFLGQLIFDVQIRQGAKTQTLIFLGLSIIFLIVPWDVVLQFVNDEKFKLNDKTYTSQKYRFAYDNYKVHHPVYKEVINKQHEKGGQTELLAFDLLDFGVNMDKSQRSKTSKRGIEEQEQMLVGDIGIFLNEPIGTKPNINHAAPPQQQKVKTQPNPSPPVANIMASLFAPKAN